jgi:chromosome partitioning protein
VRALAVASIKGGVGKTSTVVNLAGVAAETGRVPAGARTVLEKPRGMEHFVHASQAPTIDVIPADYSLRHLDVDLAAREDKNPIRKLVRQFGDRYDVVLIDCSPGLTPTVERSVHAVDGLLVPVVPSALPMRTVSQFRACVAADRKIRRLPVVPFLSMIDRRRSSHRRLADELPAEDPSFLSTSIPLSVDIETVGTQRRPVTEFTPNSKAAAAYRAAWDEIQARVPDPAA